MRPDRVTLCALAAALAAALTGEPFAQGTPAATPGIASPAPAGGPTLTPGTTTSPEAPRARTDPTSPQRRAPAATQPSAAKGIGTNAPAVDLSAPTTGTTGAAAIPGGVPTMGGITPNRAELAGSAFTKLDAANRGYLTLEDVRQLDGFESAFRQGDQNGDGRLNASEFNSAWSVYTGNVR